MGIASLVLGIIGLLLSFIPGVNILSFIPCVVGLILGIVDTVRKTNKKMPRGISISGIVLTSIAIFISIFINIVSFLVLAKVVAGEIINNNIDLERLEEFIEDYKYDTDNHRFDYKDYDF